MSLLTSPGYFSQPWPAAEESRGIAALFPSRPAPRVFLTLKHGADEPVWLPAVLDRVRTIGALAHNWDGEGAKVPTEAALTAALRVLTKLLSRESATPAVVPTPEGGVQFEWHDAGWDVEIEIDPSGVADAWGEHVARGSRFFGDVNSEDLHLAIKEITVHQASQSA